MSKLYATAAIRHAGKHFDIGDEIKGGTADERAMLERIGRSSEDRPAVQSVPEEGEGESGSGAPQS